MRFTFNSQQYIDLIATQKLAEGFDKCQMLVLSANVEQIVKFLEILSKQSGNQQKNLQKLCIQALNTKKKDLNFGDIVNLFPQELFQKLYFIKCNIRFTSEIQKLAEYPKISKLEITIENDNIRLNDLLFLSNLQQLTIRKMEFTLQEIIQLIKHCRYVEEIIIYTKHIQIQEIPTDYQSFGEVQIKSLSLNVVDGLQVILLCYLCKVCTQLKSLCYHGILIKMTQEEQQQFKSKFLTANNKEMIEEYLTKQHDQFQYEPGHTNNNYDSLQISTIETKCVNINQYNEIYKEKLSQNSTQSSIISTYEQSIVTSLVDTKIITDNDDEEMASQAQMMPKFQHQRQSSINQILGSYSTVDVQKQMQYQINYEESSESSKDSFSAVSSDSLFSEDDSQQAKEQKEDNNRQTINNIRRNSEIYDTIALRHRTTEEQSTAVNEESNTISILDQQRNRSTSFMSKLINKEKAYSQTTNQSSENSTPMPEGKTIKKQYLSAPKKLPKQNKTLIVDEIEKDIMIGKDKSQQGKSRHLRLQSLFKQPLEKSQMNIADESEKNHKFLINIRNNLLNTKEIRARSNPIIIKQSKNQQSTVMRHVFTKQQKLLRDKYINVHFRDELRQGISKQMFMFYNRFKQKNLPYKIETLMRNPKYNDTLKEQLRYLSQQRIDDLYYSNLQTYKDWKSNYDCEFNYLKEKLFQGQISQVPTIIQYYNNLQQLNFNEQDEKFYKAVDLQLEHKLELACNCQLNEELMKEHETSVEPSQMSTTREYEELKQSLEFITQGQNNPLFPKQNMSQLDNRLQIAQNMLNLSHVLLLSLPKSIMTLNISNTTLTKLDHILLCQLKELKTLICSTLHLYSPQYKLESLEKLVITNGGLIDVKLLSEVAPKLKILNVTNAIFIHSNEIHNMKLLKLSVNNSPNLLPGQLHDVIMASRETLRYLNLSFTCFPSLSQQDYLPNLYSISICNTILQTNNVYNQLIQLQQLIRQSTTKSIIFTFKEQPYICQQNILSQHQHKQIDYSSKIFAKIYVTQQLYETIKESGYFNNEIEQNVIQVFQQ